MKPFGFRVPRILRESQETRRRPTQSSKAPNLHKRKGPDACVRPVNLQMVAGIRFELTTFGYETITL